MSDVDPFHSLQAHDDDWRQTHLGRLLGHAMRRFDARVLQLMARSAEAPLALSNLAARDQVSAALAALRVRDVESWVLGEVVEHDGPGDAHLV